MTLRKADSSRVPLKYLAYWVKGERGWRVAAYKRARRPDGVISLAMLPAAVPARTVRFSADPERRARHAASLEAAERAFSDEAQVIGLGPAFAKHGSDDAMNMGSTPSFLVGAASIARAIGDGEPAGGSALSWRADRVIVASSGDLGVSLGRIRRTGDASARPIAFFTVWRRASPDAPWRYVAE
jgi:ketosteroid isomerase-like protein